MGGLLLYIALHRMDLGIEIPELVIDIARYFIFFVLLAPVDVDREKLAWRISLRRPSWLSKLLGYEIGETPTSDFPLKYQELGLFPLSYCGSIYIPLMQSETGQRSLVLSNFSYWPSHISDSEARRDVIISRLQEYCDAQGIQVN